MLDTQFPFIFSTKILCFLDWLRTNCMEIFHYLAIELQNIPIFEHRKKEVNFETDSGAIFNDFDFQPDELLSSTTNVSVFGAISNASVLFDNDDAESLIPQESVDHALVVADEEEPFFFQHLSFDHVDYDVTTRVPDDEYMQKVYNIATGSFKEFAITSKVLEIYGMRYRTEWEGPDTCYDACMALDTCYMHGSFQITREESGSLTRALKVCFLIGMGNVLVFMKQRTQLSFKLLSQANHHYN